MQPQPPLFRWDIVNRIGRLTGATRYLEIGTAEGTSLSLTEIPVRVGVDPSPQVSAVRAATLFAPMPSDVFFRLAPSLVPGPFDVVFIDGWHEARQAYRDVQGSLNLLSEIGVIVLHDCNPASEELQGPWRPDAAWTGDVWRAVAWLRSEGRHDLRVIDCDFGVGVLVPGRDTDAYPEVSLGKPPAELEWADLVSRRQELLGLVPAAEWEDWFAQVWSRRHPVDAG